MFALIPYFTVAQKNALKERVAFVEIVDETAAI